MQQSGKDDEGIFGFLKKDIEACVRTCSTKKCCYCDEQAASIECCVKSCKRNFHLICGVKNNCLFEFIDNYASYCNDHHAIEDENPKDPNICFICHEVLGAYNPLEWIPSCCGNGWFHADCMRRSALSAGYFFKCPLCGYAKEEYIRSVRKRGVFVPDQDASWELEANAYETLRINHSCGAEHCTCPFGSAHQNKLPSNKWHLLKCIYCGLNAVHRHCLGQNSTEYKCADCTIDALVTVVQCSPGSRFHLKRTIIMADDLPPPGTNYIEDEQTLLQRRLSLLFEG